MPEGRGTSNTTGLSAGPTSTDNDSEAAAKPGLDCTALAEEPAAKIPALDKAKVAVLKRKLSEFRASILPSSANGQSAAPSSNQREPAGDAYQAFHARTDIGKKLRNVMAKIFKKDRTPRLIGWVYNETTKMMEIAGHRKERYEKAAKLVEKLTSPARPKEWGSYSVIYLAYDPSADHLQEINRCGRCLLWAWSSAGTFGIKVDKCKRASLQNRIFDLKANAKVELHKGKEPWYLVMAYNATVDTLPDNVQKELKAIGLLPAATAGDEASEVT